MKVSLHAQENHRVPSAGVSKGQLDLDGEAGRWATRLPWESMRATPRRSAQLVLFARRTGNQQFASLGSSAEAFLRSGRVTVRSCNQTVEVGTFGVGVHHGIGVPHPSMVCSTLGTLVPWLPQLGVALSARAGLAQIIRSLLALCSGQP